MVLEADGVKGRCEDHFGCVEGFGAYDFQFNRSGVSVISEVLCFGTIEGSERFVVVGESKFSR